MTREEAIKRLEYIRYVGNGEQEYKNCAEAIALDMAIADMEKQIPKKIVKVKIPNTSFCKAGTRYKCPSCGEMLYSDWKFCFECGQALDWSVEND